ncbi:MAG TPA: DUF5076 domain-containing protein [Caulobacteraceae bacterium]|nr:DUF5076 domain-containing protein [Caulobacteraceae bacterium]
MSDELPIPPAVVDDPQAREIVRLWDMGNNRQQFVLNPGLWGDPSFWGFMLVDLARHVAHAYSEMGHVDEASALRQIKQAFDLEWRSPTDGGGPVGRYFPGGKR